jgi:CelD/BcsL family acetyltransferase involved in cellulose biosynthesis
VQDAFMAAPVISAAPATRRRAPVVQGPVRAEVTDAARYRALDAAWRALIPRAVTPNVSMDPAVAWAAQSAGRRVQVVLAWQPGAPGAPDRLVGAWVLAVAEPSPRRPAPALICPVDGQMVLSTPVLDREFAAEALMAMLDALAASPSLPKVLYANEFTADGTMAGVLEGVLAARGAPAKVLRRLTRSKLQSGLDPQSYLDRALPGRARKNQRRRWRRLADLGSLEVTSHRAPEEVQGAFEEFLLLEDSGWKGRAGSALARRGQATTTFVRGMVGGLARHGLVNIIALRLDGRAAASHVVLWCGGTAYTWKTAYDESLRSCGPGLLLTEEVTRALLADPNLDYADFSTNLEFDAVEAQAEFWMERLDVADLLLDVRRGGSIAFHLLGAWAELLRLRRTLGHGKRAAATSQRQEASDPD